MIIKKVKVYINMILTIALIGCITLFTMFYMNFENNSADSKINNSDKKIANNLFLSFYVFLPLYFLTLCDMMEIQ